MINQLDRQTVRAINSEIEAALTKVSRKYGISISIGSSRFSSDNCNTKLTYAVKRGGVVQTPEASIWPDFAAVNGISLKVGDRFFCNGTHYTICGAKLSSYKYPVIGQDSRGKRYKFPVSVLQGQ